MHNLEKLRILVVEDNDDDIVVLKRAIRDSGVKCELYFARDGEEALDALAQRGEFEAMPSSDLILMNINLPKIDGLEVLSKAREDERVRRIPVVVLSVSEREEDMVKAYNCGAASYMVKPVTPKEFKQLSETISSYWQLVRHRSDWEAKSEIR